MTNDSILFERASRFHDLGTFRPPHQKSAGSSQVDGFPGSQFRMSEFTGGVLVAQLRKLDGIVAALRANSSRVYQGIRDIPGARLRRLPDPKGDLGTTVFLGFETQEKRDRYLAAMKAENVPASPPSGSVILPTVPHVAQKRTIHPAWPSFTSERGRSIRYGAECCPRTIDILNRFAGVSIHPRFTERDTDDIIAAIRKVYPAVTRA